MCGLLVRNTRNTGKVAQERRFENTKNENL